MFNFFLKMTCCNFLFQIVKILTFIACQGVSSHLSYLYDCLWLLRPSSLIWSQILFVIFLLWITLKILYFRQDACHSRKQGCGWYVVKWFFVIQHWHAIETIWRVRFGDISKQSIFRKKRVSRTRLIKNKIKFVNSTSSKTVFIAGLVPCDTCNG